MNGRAALVCLPLCLLAPAAFVAACGGGGGSNLSTQPIPTPRTTVITGRMLAAPGATGEPITLMLEADPAIRATVAEDGTFTLRNVPAGNQVLRVLQRTDDLPPIALAAIANDQQVTLELRRFADEVVLTREERRGLGAAAIDFEGQVENAILVNPQGDSRFVIGSRSVIVRAGVSIVREGLSGRAVDQLGLGRRVHVRGTTIGGGPEILAYQVFIREGDESAYEKELLICHAPPGLPNRFKEVTINSNSWHSHEPHADAVGLCKP